MKCKDFPSFNERWGFLVARTSCGGGRKGSFWLEEGHGASVRDHKAASACSLFGIGLDPAWACLFTRGAGVAGAPSGPLRSLLLLCCILPSPSPYCCLQGSAAGDTLGPWNHSNGWKGLGVRMSPGWCLARDWGGGRESSAPCLGGDGPPPELHGNQAEAAPQGLVQPCSSAQLPFLTYVRCPLMSPWEHCHDMMLEHKAVSQVCLWGL